MYQEKEYLYWLCRMPALGAVSIRTLWEHVSSWADVYNMEEKQLKDLEILSPGKRNALIEWKTQLERCVMEYRMLCKENIRFVTPLDEDYPQRLREIYDYPMGLYVKGCPLPGKEPSPAVAIVGSRASSSYGEQLAEEFARSLASEGVQIISGLALGIDGASHRGALKAGGMTGAVLGCGVNICYPSYHYKLYRQMIAQGWVLSEFPPDTPPAPRNFPMRNRIISGLADVVLVVEARGRSGSLITAELALEQGRDVFAVPGRITDPLSEGCNQLIQQGAHMAISPKDILDFLGVKYKKELFPREKSIKALAKKEKMLYSCLDFRPKHLDEIVAACGLSIGECMGVLLELELGGYVFRSANHYYGKKL